MHVTSLEVSSHVCIQEFVDTLRKCLCVRKTRSREKHLKRQTLQLLLEMLHHVKQENCTLLVLFQDPCCPESARHARVTSICWNSSSL